MPTVRVATSQFVVGDDIQENLRRLLAVIDRAADGGARLVAGPEFSNHSVDWTSQDDAWNDSIPRDGEFVTAVCDKARERGIYVVFNASVRAEYPWTSDTNFLVGPDGAIIGSSDKQVLISVEN